MNFFFLAAALTRTSYRSAPKSATACGGAEQEASGVDPSDNAGAEIVDAPRHLGAA